MGLEKFETWMDRVEDVCHGGFDFWRPETCAGTKVL